MVKLIARLEVVEEKVQALKEVFIFYYKKFRR